jgi:hypothetical protein
VHQVLHWHIVDFQAFPFRSKAMPKLVKGAYSDAETYSAEDVNAIVRSERNRALSFPHALFVLEMRINHYHSYHLVPRQARDKHGESTHKRRAMILYSQVAYGKARGVRIMIGAKNGIFF